MMINKKLAKNDLYRPIDEIEEWWLDVLQSPSPEDDLNIKEVIPVDVLHLVKRILGFDDRKRYKTHKRDYTLQIPVLDKESDDDTVGSNVDSDEMKNMSKVSSTKASDSETIKAGAYIRFFQRPNYKASIWREKIYTKDQMTINQQAVALAESIAEKFVNWVATIGGEEDSRIDMESILKLFDVGTTIEYATACKVDPKEILSKINIGKYPKNMASSTEIKNITSSKSKMRPRKHNAPSCKLDREKLENMETVFKNITHLKSTGDFLQYLSDKNPVIKPPKYLKKHITCANIN